jgi:hypothetical protein
LARDLRGFIERGLRRDDDHHHPDDAGRHDDHHLRVPAVLLLTAPKKARSWL